LKQSNKNNLLLLLLAVVIIITPLILKGDSEFEGADGQAEGIIGEMHPNYEPWAEPLWEPPSGEIESLLFSLQVAIGAGTIGYIFGTFKGRKKVVTNR